MTKQFVLRMPEELKQKAHRAAKKGRLSLNSYILNILETALESTDTVEKK